MKLPSSPYAANHSTPLAGELSANGPVILAADIGGSNLRLALATSDGRILNRWHASTKELHEPASVLSLIESGADLLLDQAGLSRHHLSSVAAGAPGLTDVDRGVVVATSYLLGWRDVPLRHLLEEAFSVPAAIDNDVNMAAIGEGRAGAARQCPDYVLLAIGTGFGAGIVLSNRLHRGVNGMAGEIGYMLVPGITPAPTTMGSPGDFEALISGAGIQEQWRSCWDQKQTTLDRHASATEIFDHAHAGNQLALRIFEQAARNLAYGIYNVALILDTPLFVLAGSVGIHPALVDRTRTLLHELNPQVHPRLLPSSLGTDAQLVGAVHLALDLAQSAAGR